MNHLLTHDGLQEIPLENIDFSLLTDGLISKTTMANILGMVLQLLLMLLRQHLYLCLLRFSRLLHSLTGTCTFAKGKKTINIYTGSKYAFGTAHDFGVLQCSFLPSDRNKI